MGILWQQPEALRPFMTAFGIDWERSYGDKSLQVPIPATFLVDKTGVVRNSFVDADYTKRLEPAVALAWCDAL
jgi:peroxiredoxin